MILDQMAAAGYQQYEISNWAVNRDGNLLACVHNLQYWHNDPYLGFGAGAHGYSQGTRTANVSRIEDYLARLKDPKALPFPLSPANDTRIEIDEKARLQEGMMVGLRLTNEGIARSHYMERYQVDIYEKYQKQIDLLVRNGLLEWGAGEKEQLRLTRQGRLLGNQVFMQFIGEDSD
jgi:oxygen-independent coproporphyrinogen-3 oxidase